MRLEKLANPINTEIFRSFISEIFKILEFSIVTSLFLYWKVISDKLYVELIYIFVSSIFTLYLFTYVYDLFKKQGFKYSRILFIIVGLLLGFGTGIVLGSMIETQIGLVDAIKFLDI